MKDAIKTTVLNELLRMLSNEGEAQIDIEGFEDMGTETTSYSGCPAVSLTKVVLMIRTLQA